MDSPHANRSFTPVVTALLVLNGVLYLLQQIMPNPLIWWLALWPADAANGSFGTLGPQLWPWQLLSYSFLHGSLTHLFFNMFALWMFGSAIERAFGSRRFAIYYIVCVLGAAFVQLLVVNTPAGTIPTPTIGASGGVFGILLAFGVLFPNNMIMLLIPPIPLKAKYFVVIYGALELVFGVSGARDGIAHFAHLGGMFFGLGLILYWRAQARRARQRLEP